MANIISIITSNTSPGSKRTNDNKSTVYMTLLDAGPRGNDRCNCSASTIAVHLDATVSPKRALQFFKYDKKNDARNILAAETNGNLFPDSL